MSTRMRQSRLVIPPLLLSALVCTTAAAAGPDLRLVDAAQRQDTAIVRALLARHADVNVAQPDGATALAWAAHWDDIGMADLLIDAGANVNVGNQFGVTPLSLACVNGSKPMVDRLLRAGADPNRARANGEAPLMTAARTGNPDVVSALLAHGADVNAHANPAGQTALMWAISETHPAVTRVLVRAGADVHMRSAGGYTALLFAARAGDVDSARVLLDAGSDVYETAPDGSSPLLVASASGRESTAVLLLDRGANPNADRAGYTALHAAIPKSELDLVKALLAHGANPNARVTNAPAAVFGPAGGAGSEVADGALVLTSARGGASPRPPRSSVVTATPFWLAAKYVNVSIMRALIAGGADPALTTDDGTTPLMVAAGLTQFEGPRSRRGDVSTFRSNWGEDDALEAVAVLMDLGADVNAVNRVGQTALHGAAYLGANRLVELLVQKHAKLNAQDARSQTPFRVAEGHLNVSAQGVTSNPQTAELLRRLGADASLGIAGTELLRRLQREAAALSADKVAAEPR
jgi:ankyrin repeat protein